MAKRGNETKLRTVAPLGPEPRKPSNHVIGTFYKKAKNLYSIPITNNNCQLPKSTLTLRDKVPINTKELLVINDRLYFLRNLAPKNLYKAKRLKLHLTGSYNVIKIF